SINANFLSDIYPAIRASVPWLASAATPMRMAQKISSEWQRTVQAANGACARDCSPACFSSNPLTLSSSPRPSPCVELIFKGSQPPSAGVLILLHPIGGEIFDLLRLAPHFRSSSFPFNVVAVRSPAWAGITMSDAQYATMDAVASVYATQLLSD